MGKPARHPIKTLRALLEMGATRCLLLSEEAEFLIQQFEQLFHENLPNHQGTDDGSSYKAEYGMDEKVDEK